MYVVKGRENNIIYILFTVRNRFFPNTNQVWLVNLKSYLPRVFYSNHTGLVCKKKCETVLASLLSRSEFVLARVNSN